jgi:protoporphyrinogen/coproporphyrinogen III oxidase
MRRVLVLGAGISGLTVAYRLKMAGVAVTVLEATGRAGGWIETVREKEYLFELGPRSCRPRGSGARTLALACELGLEKELLPAHPTAHRRFLYLGGRLRPLSLFRPSSPWRTWAALWAERRIPKTTVDDESVHDFLSRRFSRHLADQYADAITTGIYAGDPRLLSTRSCFPRLWDLEQNYGSILRGFRRENAIKSPHCKAASLFSFREGMESLPRALAAVLDRDLVFNCPARAICLNPDWVSVKTDKGEYRADHLYCALPLATSLALMPPLHSSALAFQQKASVAVVNLGYRVPLKVPRGFGYLTAHDGASDLLGVVWDSQIFPSQSPGTMRLAAMVGGIRRPDLVDLPAKALIALVESNLCRQLGIRAAPDVWRVDIARDAIPQYAVGHHQQVTQLQQTLQPYPVTLLGNGLFGVSINDCISRAEICAATWLRQTAP